MKKETFKNRIALQGGAYSLVITAIVLAILVAVNILVSALPKNVTQHDISSTKLYSVTSNTKVVVNALDQDVTIYWIVQSDREIRQPLRPYPGGKKEPGYLSHIC